MEEDRDKGTRPGDGLQSRAPVHGKYGSLEEALLAGEGVTIVPQGWSMHPTIDPGDKVTLAPLGNAFPRKGDIVLFRDRKRDILVLHRVIRVDAAGIFTCGDQQTTVEGPVNRNDIYGAVTDIIRRKSGKTISAENPGFRMWSGFWGFLRPVRGPLVRTGAALKRRLAGKKQ